MAAMKMSKSKAGSAIPILADEAEVSAIMKTAWCPEGVVEENPVLQLCRYIIFPTRGELKVERPAKFGGDVAYSAYGDLESDFKNRKLHPMDLKNAVSRSISSLTAPIVKKFSNQKAQLKELFKQ